MISWKPDSSCAISLMYDFLQKRLLENFQPRKEVSIDQNRVVLLSHIISIVSIVNEFPMIYTPGECACSKGGGCAVWRRDIISNVEGYHQ